MLDALDRRWLRELLARAVRCSLASSLALPACVADTVEDCSSILLPPGVVSSCGVPYQTVIEPRAPCAGGWDIAPFFTLSREVDYVADRVARWSQFAEPAYVASESGVACATAVDQTRCFDALRTPVVNLGRHLLTTAGDEVLTWNGREARVLFGSVDVAEEAIWLALAGGAQVDCDARIAEVAAAAGGGFFIDVDRFVDDCYGPRTVHEVVHVASGGTDSTISTTAEWACPPPGRRPQGLRPRARSAAACSLGERFAAMAHMEAASVPAFAAIAAELSCHAAPASLARGARRALRDEIRHARIAGAFARRFGAEPAPAVVTALPPRSLAAFALDNAIEGCVHETFAAARASHQAASAHDPGMRRALRGIAADESRHAALAWAIAEWVTPKLSAATRARVREAQREAVAALGAQLDAEPHDASLAWAGLPAANASRTMFDALRRTLWAA